MLKYIPSLRNYKTIPKDFLKQLEFNRIETFRKSSVVGYNHTCKFEEENSGLKEI